MNLTDKKTDFQAPAALMKWPSRKGQRVSARDGAKPYTIVEASLDDCLRRFMAKPASSRHLYEIHTAPKTAEIAVLSPEAAIELARLREFL